jgi:hypothetical protein
VNPAARGTQSTHAAAATVAGRCSQALPSPRGACFRRLIPPPELCSLAPRVCGSARRVSTAPDRIRGPQRDQRLHHASERRPPRLASLLCVFSSFQDRTMPNSSVSITGTVIDRTRERAGVATLATGKEIRALLRRPDFFQDKIKNQRRRKAKDERPRIEQGCQRVGYVWDRTQNYKSSDKEVEGTAGGREGERCFRCYAFGLSRS